MILRHIVSGWYSALGRRRLLVLATALAVAGTVSGIASATPVSDNPFGRLDAVSQSATGLDVEGWAIDDDTNSPLDVQVLVNSRIVTTAVADINRPDVAAAHPGRGSAHGFDVPLTLTAGRDTVCVIALNRGPGHNSMLGCRTVQVSFSPSGSLDWVHLAPGTFSIVGGAADPNTSSPIQVQVYLDSVQVAQMPANTALHHGHGYAATFPVSQGAHTVCVRALNVGAGSDAQIGCRAFSVNDNPTAGILWLKQSSPGFQVQGYATDPDTTAPINTIITADGQTLGTVLANGVGVIHGPHLFTAAYPLPNGTHTICAIAVNVGAGNGNSPPACQTITLNFNPTAGILWLKQSSPGFQVQGYATDPDTTAPLNTIITADGQTLGTVLANGVGVIHGPHLFTAAYPLPNGTHTICAIAVNVGAGNGNSPPACQTITLNFNPTAGILWLKQSSPGFQVQGYATDPDTTAPINTIITADGQTLGTVLANGVGVIHGPHLFTAAYPLPNGTHTICAIAVNVGAGNGNSPPACQTITLNFNPYGRFESVTRAGATTNLTVTGWAIDPDTTHPLSVSATVDGLPDGSGLADLPRPDVAALHPGTGAAHGFSMTLTADTNEHRVCITAINVDGGSGNTLLGCTIIDAVHPVAPSAPQAVSAVAGYGGASVSWQAPPSDGGAPWAGYQVIASPGGASTQVGPGATTATVLGLKPSSKYTFAVHAWNVAGASPTTTSPAVTTQASPPPQTTPAPISTSRYIRNITAASAADQATMRAEGASDAAANPSGHGYLILLDIGGQDQTDGGVVLSATTRFVSYPDLVTDLQAYVAGYASQQRPSAPAVIALGTNNDMDVSTASGASWASAVVNPVRAYAAHFLGMTIAGADDIEPGFTAGYAQSKLWLNSYLATTSAPFVFNGSADGCAWTITNGRCNNGWTMADLYYLSGGANPVRIIGLPQVYNDTMAAQWKYISLTGVGNAQPKINFGGALTEWTACHQSGSCGSLTGNYAWTQMWAQLRSTPALMPPSLPYSTDLRIN